MMDKKILVVDDEITIRELYVKVLTKSGYTVFAAGSAEEALELLEESPYLVYFLDLNLPGMNGVELCRNIKKQLPVSIIYAVTGYATFFEISSCREAGFDDYFTKPVQLSDLTEAAADAFRKLDKWNKRN